MKPTKLQYFFAQGWIERIWFIGVPLICALMVMYKCELSIVMFGNWKYLLMLFGTAILSLLLGLFIAIILGIFVLCPFCYERELKNGGPFRKGDIVQILAGRHRGKITRVYSLWQGDTVRVELGDKEKENFKDIFSPMQLLRENVEKTQVKV